MARRFHHELLLQARLDLGMTQEEAAATVGMDVRTYRRYESGSVNDGSFSVRHPSRRRILARLSRELGLDESDLLVEDGGTDAAPALPGAPPASAAPDRTWSPLHAHTLQRARHFVGRADVLAALRVWADQDPAHERVIALVGLGGTGKTAVAERLVAELGSAPRPGGLYVWSCFENPRTEDLLARALAYFAPAASASARPDVLEHALADGAPHVLVLDGLELVQSEGTAARAFGELEDPVLRRLLTAAARGLGRTRVLVTSRFALTDLSAWEGAGLATWRLPPLPEDQGMALLRQWGVHGTSAALGRLHGESGGHALSLAMLGSYIGAMCGGNPAHMASVPWPEAARDDALARRLQGVMDTYAAALDTRAHDLLARLAVLAEGASADVLADLAAAGGAVAGSLAGADRAALQRELARLERLGLVFASGPGLYSTHPFVRQYFQVHWRAQGPERRLASAPYRGTRRDFDAWLRGARTSRGGGPVLRRLSGPSLATRTDAWPSDPARLDRHEALLVHLLRMDRPGEAYAVYARTMGGFANLGLRQGGMIRGARILRAFAEDGDPARMAPTLRPAIRRAMAHDWGLYGAALGDLAFARRCYQAAVDMARDMRDAVSYATGLRSLAYTERLAGDIEAARDRVRASIALSEHLARKGYGEGHLVKGLAFLGAVLHDMGEVSEAAACFERARSLVDMPVARRALWEAEHLLDMGAHAQARAATEYNLRYCESVHWHGHAAHCHAVLGHLATIRGDLAAAAVHLAQARTWVAIAGEMEMELRCRELDARIALAAGRSEDATRAIADALHLARTSGFGWFVSRLSALQRP